MYKIPANTLFIGHSLVFMPECHSTNTEALRIIQTDKIVEGTVVITDNQTAGRGQRTNTWESEPGKNLTFSIILKPHFIWAKDQFYLNMCVALSLADFLRDLLGNGVAIKWPNDMMVNDKKIGGILIENQVSGQHLQSSVVGIGLNVNQQKFRLNHATSLNMIMGKVFNLADVLERVLEKIEKRYLDLRQQKTLTFSSEYITQLYRLGEEHEFVANQKSFKGTIIGIDEVGRLLINGDDGVRVFSAKEVEFVPLT